MYQSSILKSFVFVTIQFLCLGLIAVTGPIVPANTFLLTVEIAGLGLGIWAVLSMGLGNFNITPDVKRNSHLVTAGPYALIRHPMYTALLLVTVPLIVNSFNGFRLFMWLLLLVDLLLKLTYEETLLKRALPGYSEYMQKSHRLIPFVF